jgi:hypothetical protein
VYRARTLDALIKDRDSDIGEIRSAVALSTVTSAQREELISAQADLMRAAERERLAWAAVPECARGNNKSFHEFYHGVQDESRRRAGLPPIERGASSGGR